MTVRHLAVRNKLGSGVSQSHRLLSRQVLPSRHSLTEARSCRSISSAAIRQRKADCNGNPVALLHGRKAEEVSTQARGSPRTRSSKESLIIPSAAPRETKPASRHWPCPAPKVFPEVRKPQSVSQSVRQSASQPARQAGRQAGWHSVSQLLRLSAATQRRK